MAERLRSAGFEVHEGVGGTGVVAVLRNGDGDTVLLRADMDGLPVREATGLSYASTVTAGDPNGKEVPVMHACRHDVHVSCLLGAAQLLADGRDAWRGTLVALFQPAEETGEGARGMLDGGLADLIPPPDVALAQHVLPFPAGLVGTHSGPMSAAATACGSPCTGGAATGPRRRRWPTRWCWPPPSCCGCRPSSPARSCPGKPPSSPSAASTPARRATSYRIRRSCWSTSAPTDRTAGRRCSARSAASSPPSARRRHARGIPSWSCTRGSRSPTTTRPPPRGWRMPSPVSSATRRCRSRSCPRARTSAIPTAFGIPYTYWAIGGVDPSTFSAAELAGQINQDIPVNHSARFAPLVQPTRDTGTQALVVAALTWL